MWGRKSMSELVRLVRRDVAVAIGCAIVLTVIVVAAFPQLVAETNPYRLQASQRLEPPGKGHVFGTDELGRDMLARIVYGSRFSLRAGILVVLLAVSLGGVFGILAGYRGGLVDTVVMRIADVFMSFPPLVMAMALVAALGASLNNAILALGIVWWPGYARLLRIAVVSVKESGYVETARACGVSGTRILFRHILPNCMGPIIVKATLDIGLAILSTAALSFLGLGARPPTPEWGALVTSGRLYLLDFWWYATFPGLAIFVTVLGFNLLGDGLRDVMDPHSIT